MDDISYLDPESINGLNLYAYCGNNSVMIIDPSGNSFLDFLAVMAMGWAVTTIASNIFGGHLVGGVSSTVGGIAVVSGAVSIAFGTAELQKYFVGNNWMKDAGMSDGWYNGLMIGNSILGAAVSIGGVKYMSSMHGQRAYAYQNVGKYKYTKTVAGKVSERPYIFDVSKHKMVIKNGTMAIDTKVSPTSIFAGGRNYNFVYADWSLTISNTHKTIYHFLYAASIRGMY